MTDVLTGHERQIDGGKAEPASATRATLDACLAQGERVRPLIGDVTAGLRGIRAAGGNVLMEGAQGTLLDVDHGTYPFVTSSNTVAGYAAVGTGLGARDIDGVLGVSARLPNGVTVELECTAHDAALVTAMITALGAH